MQKTLILTLFLVILSPLGIARVSAQNLEKADLLVENAKIITMDPAKPRVEAMVISQGRIVATGKASELIARFAPKRKMDLHGKNVLPGLTDAHGHLMGLGLALLSAELGGASSKEEVIERVKKFALTLPDHNSWLVGRGWDQNLWPDPSFPNHQDLDQVFKDRPVWLERVDGHAAWANSKVLALAGITRATADPEGGKILRDSKGEPTGVFIDNAMNLIDKMVPEPSEIQNQEALKRAVTFCRTNGITSVHDAGINLKTYRLMEKAAQKKDLGLRVYAMFRGADSSFDAVCAEGPKTSDFLTLRSVKLFADGALGSRGAALLADYSDEPGNRGLLLLSPEEMNRSVEKVYRCGFQVAIHAIGDRGNRVALDAIERAIKLSGRKDLRPRIEHAQVVSPPDFPRFKSLGVIASMQPTHATSDMPWAEKRVGPERIQGAYSWRKFWDMGVVLAAGSDFPVERVNPFEGLYSAVNRAGWYPAQKLTRMEALKAFTQNAAFAAFQEKEQGSLEAGKWADFIVVNQDLLEIAEDQIKSTQVLETYLAGDKVY